MWQDSLLVVLPATSPLAGLDVVPMSALAELPLRIVERRTNPPLVDLGQRQLAYHIRVYRRTCVCSGL